MALAGVKYFNAVSTNKRFVVKQHDEMHRIDAMQRRMLGRVWKEKEDLLNEFIKINVRTPTGSAGSRHIELKQMAVDPRLVLPMDGKARCLKHQAVIVPVITIDGRGATLYPKKGAKHGRHIELTSKVFERMHKANNISSNLEYIASGSRRKVVSQNVPSQTTTKPRVKTSKAPEADQQTTDIDGGAIGERRKHRKTELDICRAKSAPTS